MPAPLALALPAIIEAVGDVGALAYASLLAYVGYEKVSSSVSFGSAPSGKNPIPVVFPTVKKTAPVVGSKPSSALSNALKPVVSAASDSVIRQKESSVSASAALDEFAKRVNEKNSSLSSTAGNSKFLQQQVESKSSLDQVAFAVNSQSVVLAMIYESLERNLSLMAAASVANAKLNDLTSGQVDSSDDLPYVDSGSFYDLLSQSNPDMDSYRLSQAKVLENEIVSGGVLRGVSYSDIKKDVDSFRSTYFFASELAPVRSATAGISTSTISSSVPSVTVSVPAQAAPVVNVASVAPVVNVSPAVNVASAAPVVNVASAVPDITVNVPAQAAPVVNVDIPDYSDKLERMASAADSAKIVSEHAHTVRDIHDLDGNVIASVAPMVLSSIKEASIAREKTDVINLEFDDTDLPSIPDIFPLLQFSGRKDIYNPSFALSSTNPFMPKNM